MAVNILGRTHGLPYTNFQDLFADYLSDHINETCKTWIICLPLWISALFEYRLFGNIQNNVKYQLRDSLKGEKDWKYLYIFLQSFVVDLTRQKLNEENINFVSNFCKLIKDAE